MKLTIRYNNKPLSANILLANTPITRIIGLMFDKSPQGEGLLLEPCNAIHTFFMRYALDIVFLSKTNRVVKIMRALPPWRITRIYVQAAKTLELPAGKLPKDLKEGDKLEIGPVEVSSNWESIQCATPVSVR